MNDRLARPEPVKGKPVDQEAQDRESRLVRLLDEAASQWRAGKTPDREALGREDAELLAELRQLWATAMLADEFVALPRELDPDPDELDASPDQAAGARNSAAASTPRCGGQTPTNSPPTFQRA